MWTATPGRRGPCQDGRGRLTRKEAGAMVTARDRWRLDCRHWRSGEEEFRDWKEAVDVVRGTSLRSDRNTSRTKL